MVKAARRAGGGVVEGVPKTAPKDNGPPKSKTTNFSPYQMNE